MIKQILVALAFVAFLWAAFTFTALWMNLLGSALTAIFGSENNVLIASVIFIVILGVINNWKHIGKRPNA